MSTRDAVDSRIPGTDPKETPACESPKQLSNRTEHHICTRQRQVVNQSGALGRLVQNEEYHGKTRTGQEFDQSHDNDRRGRELTGPSVLLNSKQLQTKFTSYISLRFPPKRRRTSDLAEHRAAELSRSTEEPPHPEISVKPVSRLLSLEKTSNQVQDDVATPPTGSGYLTSDQRRAPFLAFGQLRQTTDNGTADTDTNSGAVESRTLEPLTAHTRQLEPTDVKRCRPAVTKRSVNSLVSRVSSKQTESERLDPRGSDTPVAVTACTSSLRVDECLCKGSSRVVTQNSSVAVHPAAMLSSTVVSVLAPNWAARRRQKRAEQEAQGSQQEVIEGGRFLTLQNTQEVERGDKAGSPSQGRALSLGYGDRTSPVSPISSSMASQTATLPLSRELHAQQEISQTGRYGDKLSFLSSKPKTSSLLLSLRRVNSASPTHSNPAPPTLSRSINDRAAGSSIQRASSASTNDNEQERSKSLLSSFSTPYRIIERSWPHHLSTSRNQREADTHRISTPPSHQEPETSSVYLTPPYSPKHTPLSSGLERTKEDDLTSSRPSQHGRLDRLTKPSPRKTQLKASWCKTKDQSFSSSLFPPTNKVNNQICENNNNMSPSSDSSNKTVRGMQADLNSGWNPQRTNNANNNHLGQLGHHGNMTFADSWADPSALRLAVTPQEPGDKHSHAFHPHTSPAPPTDAPSSHTPTLCKSQQDLSLTEAPSERQVQKTPSLSSVYYSTRMRRALSPTSFSRSTLGLNRTEPGLDRGRDGESLTTPLGSELRTHNPRSLLASSPKSSSSPPVPSSYTPRSCRFSSGPISTTFCSTTTGPPSSPGSSCSIPQPLLPNHTTSSQFSLPSKATPATTPANTNTTSQPISPRTSSMPSLSPNPSHTPNPTSPPDSPLSPQSPLTQGMKLCPPVEPRVLASRAPWQDSGELHSGETTTREQHFPPGSPPGLTSPTSPSRHLRSVEGPSIFASLRSGGSSWVTSPRSSSGTRSSSLSAWRGEREKQSPSHSCPDSAGRTGGEVEGEKEGEKEKEDREKEGREKEKRDLSGRSLTFTFDHNRNGASGTIPQKVFSKESASSSNYNAPLSLQSDFGSRSRHSFSPPPYHTLKASSPIRTSLTSPTTPLSKSPSISLSSPPHCTLPISPPVSPYSPTFAHKQTSSWDRSKDVVTENNPANSNSNSQTLHDSVALHTSRIETHVDDITRPSPTPFSAHVDKPLPPSRVTVVETLVYTIPSSSSSSKEGIQLSHSYSGRQAPRTVIANSDPLQIAHRRQLTGGISCQSQPSSNDSKALGQQCSPTDQIRGHLLENTGKGCRERGIPATEKKSERGWRESNSPPEAPPPGQANRKGLFRNKRDRPAPIAPAATPARGTETAQTEKNKRDVERREGEVERGERANEKDKRGPTKMDLVLQRLKQTFNIKSQSDELPSRRKRTSPPTSDPDAAPDAKVTPVTNNRGSGQEREIQRHSSVQTSLDQGSRGEEEGEGGRGGGRVQTDRETTRPDIPPAGVRTGHPQFGALRGQGRGQDRHWFSMIDLSSPDALRSPLSSPSSPLSRKDWGDDSVFYSPAPQRMWGRKKASSFCESGDGETGGQESQVRGQGGVLASYSSCADLKYGLKAGRTISVSSVLSSRPACPRRISTGPDMVSSVTDLHDPAVTSRGVAGWVDQSTGQGDWFMTNRSGFRSLPRHGTRGLEVTSLGLSSSLDTSHFLWDAVGPPTPPLTPPSRRMSRSSSTSPSSPPCSAGGWVSPDSHASRGRLPSRGYVSSLSAFEESDADSDTSSDTTTDDEYYLGDRDTEEKETEL